MCNGLKRKKEAQNKVRVLRSCIAEMLLSSICFLYRKHSSSFLAYKKRKRFLSFCLILGCWSPFCVFLHLLDSWREGFLDPNISIAKVVCCCSVFGQLKRNGLLWFFVLKNMCSDFANRTLKMPLLVKF